MEDEKKLILLIVNHLKNQINSGKFNDESLESMEVAVQCIESAYSLNPTESDEVDDANLEYIFKEYYKSTQSIKSEISEAAKEEAEFHKQCGNDFLKAQNYKNAIASYTKSILLNPNNPIYYGNRAAAYNDIGKYQDAIEDCQKAIAIDPSYCKAYCRLGLAFSCLKDYHKAVSCYKKACELDPDNPGHQRNYQISLNSLQNDIQQRAQPQNESTGEQQNLMETAAQLINNPEVSSVLTNLLGDATNASNGGLDRLMQVGQTIVSRLQTANPNLLDGLRVQFQNVQNAGQPPPHNGSPNQNNN